jgi:hypothetical protein
MNDRDSLSKMLSLALRQCGVGLAVFAIANLAATRVPGMALRALVGVTTFACGAILECKRKG